MQKLQCVGNFTLGLKIFPFKCRPPHAASFPVSFPGTRLRKWIHKNRRVGRPRSNWTEETINEIWDYIRKDDDRYKYTRFDNDKEEHIEYIKQHASTHT